MNIPQAPKPAETNQPDRVSFRAKAAYGAGTIQDNLIGHIPQQMTQPIFVLLLGMNPAILSTVAIIFRLWDAFIDPYIGMKSDNLRSRWGRRKPFMVVGCVLTAIWFPIIWLASPGWSANSIVGWYIVSMLVLATTHSIWSVCYQSMLMEITPDYAERTSVTAYRAFFSKFAGLAIGWFWFLTQLPVFFDSAGNPDALFGTRVLSVGVSVIVLIVGLLPVFFVKERFSEVAAHQPKVSMKESMKLTLSNKPFLLLSGVSLCFLIGTYLVQGLSFYITTFHVFQGDTVKAAALQGFGSIAQLIVGLLGIPLFQWLAHRFGKTKALGISILSVLSGSLVTWWTMTPDYPWLSLTINIFNAPGYTGIWMLIPSMLADVGDHDELATGERREGSFASIYSWMFKMAQTIAYGLSGPMIVLAGFVAGVKTMPPPDVLLNMRILYAFFPALFLISAILILTRYPLSPDVVHGIRAKLEARRGKV